MKSVKMFTQRKVFTNVHSSKSVKMFIQFKEKC